MQGAVKAQNSGWARCPTYDESMTYSPVARGGKEIAQRFPNKGFDFEIV